jgi:iron complex transport system ATP-binding protein
VTVEVRSLTYRFRDLVALSDVSASAEPGRITAIVGPNAAGKSTLLRCMLGTLRPLGGEAVVDGRPAHRLSARQAARRIAYVPQRSSVAAAFVVRDVVELGRYALPADASRVDEALTRMELVDLVDRPYTALSVGQQQRVTLARALAQLEPDGNLLLDEPLSAMDLAHARHAMQVLREVADAGATVVIVLHDLPLAAAFADDAWLLREAMLVARGTVAEVLTAELLADVFGVPFDSAGRPRMAP